MRYLIFTLGLLSLAYLVFAILFRKKLIDVNYLNLYHTSVLKGIAILMVILSHMGHKFGMRYLAPLGGAGVALFLLISAYGLSESFHQNGLKKFWRKRLLGVFLPYFIIQTIDTLWNGGSMLSYVLDITFLSPKHPFGWYLSFLLAQYIFFYLIHRFPILYRYRLILYGLSSFVLLWIPNELWAEQAISFTIGIFLVHWKQHKKELFQKCMTHPLYKSLLLFLIGTAFLAIKQMDAIRSLPEPFVYAVQLITKVGYALTILTASYGLKNYLDFHFFYFVGGLSYQLYLLHGYTYYLLNSMSFIQIVFFFVITFILAWILMWVSKKFLGFSTHSLTCRK